MWVFPVPMRQGKEVKRMPIPKELAKIYVETQTEIYLEDGVEHMRLTHEPTGAKIVGKREDSGKPRKEFRIELLAKLDGMVKGLQGNKAKEDGE